MRVVVALSILAPSVAFAQVAPECEGLARPADYDEQVQQDHIQNYFALAGSYSPGHGAIPHAPGHGALGVQVSLMPPLSCAQRMVLDWSKTEDTNKSPVLPRIFASYAFPVKGIAVPYASLAFLPPISINGTRNVVISGEVGLGVKAHRFVEAGARFHLSMQRTYGDVATAFDPEDAPVEDVFVGSTWGFDGLVSFPVEVTKATLTPFLAVGYTNASTFFLVGDDRFVGNNLHPYSSAALSVGLDTLIVEHVRLAAEFYAAPGGYSLPDDTAESLKPASRYGHLYTARGRLAYEF